MEQYRQQTSKYVTLCLKLNFFDSCKSSKIIPKGLVSEKNVATHVNDQLFIEDVQQTLNESSSRILDKDILSTGGILIFPPLFVKRIIQTSAL